MFKRDTGVRISRQGLSARVSAFVDAGIGPDESRELAREEMLDEQHAMLIAICEKVSVRLTLKKPPI